MYKELKSVRNIHPAIAKYGLYGGMAYAGVFHFLGRGLEPWTFGHGRPDCQKVMPKEKFNEIEYPKPDGKLTFDLLSSVALTSKYEYLFTVNFSYFSPNI